MEEEEFFFNQDRRTEEEKRIDKDFDKMAWRVILHRKIHRELQKWYS